MSGASKALQERNQRLLLELLAKPGNDVCADCKSRNPRWASHNLGIFICVNCASIHRKIGTHVTKVKSLTLDSWTKEQVEHMRAWGNTKANELYNPDERRNPLPANMEESERDSELEKYIRGKYEHKRFMNKSKIVEQHLGPSKSRVSVPARSRTAPLSASAHSHGVRTPEPPLPGKPPTVRQDSLQLNPPQALPRSASAALPISPPASTSTFSQPGSSAWTPSHSVPAQSQIASTSRSMTNPFPQTMQIPQSTLSPSQQATLSQSTFDDLIGLQAPASNSSLPLQYQSPTSSFTQSPFTPGMVSSPPIGLAQSGNPYANWQSPTATGQPFQSPFAPFNASQVTRSATLPVFGQPTGTNPYQFATQDTLSPQALSPGTNPYSAHMTGTPMSISPHPQSFAPNAFSPQPQAGSSYPNASMQPFGQTPSPSPFGAPFQQQPAPVQASPPLPPPGSYPSQSPYSAQAQQAQQLFQSMASGRNPFGA